MSKPIMPNQMAEFVTVLAAIEHYSIFCFENAMMDLGKSWTYGAMDMRTQKVIGQGTYKVSYAYFMQSQQPGVNSVFETLKKDILAKLVPVVLQALADDAVEGIVLQDET